jgi:lysophospholipase L1-like esterase
LLFWAILLGTSLAAAAILGEAMARWRERHRSSPPGTMGTLFYLHRRLLPMPVHNRDYFGWVHIDSLGLRGRDVALRKPDGTTRIVADGGSTTFDTAVSSDDSTWAAQLERALRTAGKNVQVLNAGVPGHTVLDNLIRLQIDLFRLEPDVLLIQQGHNDLYGALLDGRVVRHTNTPGELQPAAPWTYWLARNSVLYGQLMAAWRAWTGQVRGDRALPEGDHTLPLDSALLLGEQSFERNLTAYVLSARAMGIRVVLMEPVHSSVGARPGSPVDSVAYRNAYPAVPVETILEGYRRYRDVIRRVAAATGADFIATDAFGLGDPALYDSADPVHLRDAGSRILGERLADALTAQGIIP